MKHKSIFISCLVLLFIVGASNGATHTRASATFTVDSTADAVDANPGDGTCATAAGQCTLRASVQEANALAGADTIILPAGTYTLALAGADDQAGWGDLDITADLTITGASATTTIVDAGGIDRVFDILSDSRAAISGLTIQNGTVLGYLHGGGIRNQGTLTLSNSAVSRNTTLGNGGGIENRGTMTIIRSTVSDNTSSTNAGGISNFRGTLTISNSTISGNATNNEGGGIQNASDSTLTLNNVTIVNNTCDMDNVGGGVAGGLENFVGATVNLRNTLISGNKRGAADPLPDDCFGALTSQGHNLIQTTSGCTIAGDTTGNIIGQDPKLGPLADNGGPSQTHALLAGSPAIDAGNPAPPGSGGNSCEATDQRGVGRPVDGDGDGTATCDIGAYEFEYAVNIYLPVVLKNYPRADVIFHNGTVLTMEADQPQARAIAVRGEKILAVGSDVEVLALQGPGTEVIDLEGRTLLPGFIDSHAHWIGDRDFAGYTTPEEAIQAALENGWTSVSELFVNQDRLDELRALDRDGRLRLRVNAYLPLKRSRPCVSSPLTLPTARFRRL